MKEVSIIHPSANLIEKVVKELPGDTTDYTRSIVVFPGKRPAHFLRKALAEQSGKSFFPPIIFSIDNFIAFLHTEKLGDQSRLLEPIDAVAILYDIHSRTERKLGQDHYRSFDQFFPVGLQLFNELEEVMLTHLPVSHVQSMLQNIEYPKFRSLGFYYEWLYAEIERRGYATRSTMYRRVADSIDTLDIQSYERMILAGFYAFTKTESVIVQGLLRNENVRLIVQGGTGLRERLKNLGATLPRQSDEHPPDPSVHFYRSPDTHGQVFALAAKLEEQIRSGKTIDERTVIVLPSAEALFPVIHHALSLIPNEHYNISLGYPLSRTPAFGFLNTLLEVVASSRGGKFSSADYLQFVLHPYTKNIRYKNRSESTRILIHALEEHLAVTASKIIFTLDDLEGEISLFESIAGRLQGIGEEVTSRELQQHLAVIHRNTIRKFLGVTSIKDFAIRSIEVLQYIFDESTANLHPFFKPYVERLTEILDRLSRSLIGEQRFDDISGYSTFMKGYIAGQSVPFAGTPLQGIQVLGLLETRNLSFDTVYFLDTNDDVLPGTTKTDMLLPFPIRKMLGLETSYDREQLSAYYFDLVIANAKAVHLFFTEAGKKEKSRFVERLLWKRQQEERNVSSKEFERQVKYTVKLTNDRPKPVGKTPAMVQYMQNRLRHNASTLNTYLHCPLQFYYQSVLGLRDRVDISDDIDASDVGRFVHTILKEYFTPMVGVPLSKDQLSVDNLVKVIDRCFDEEYGHDVIGAAYFLKKQIHHQVRAFLEGYQHPAVTSHRVMISDLERDINVDYKGFRFSGRIDRIELRDGITMILDYKTGHDDKAMNINIKKLDISDRSTWSDAIHSFQLPMYMLLYAASTQKSLDTIIPAYLFLGKTNLNSSIEVGLGDGTESPAQLYQAIEPVIIALINEILDVQQPFQPTDDLEKHCPRCPYTTICGTQWIKGWKNS